MLSALVKPSTFNFARRFSTTKQNNVKVAIAGASGLVGQPLSLLLKQCPLIKELRLHGLQASPGVVADLSHVETPTKVIGFHGSKTLSQAFKGADIIVMAAGAPRKPGMTKEDMFKGNAPIVCELAQEAAANAANALITVISNPLNSTVPIVAEVLKKVGKYEPRRLFGVTTLDSVRANTFLAELKKLNPLEVKVPVIGGNSEKTIIPVISQATPNVSCSKDELKALAARVQGAGNEVIKAKAGAGPARLSMAYAAARFVVSLIRALRGEQNIIECAYVPSNVTGVKYFATPLLLGKNGVEKNLGLGKLNDFEEELLNKALPELKKDIQMGEDFVK